MDMPDLPPQYAQVMIVQAGTEKKGAAKIDRTLSVCQVIENPANPSTPEEKVSAINSIDPTGWVENYFSQQERRKVEGPGRVTVLQKAAHGSVETDDSGNYLYIPAPGYLGRDRAVVLVEKAGMKIRIVYSFRVVHMVNQDTEGLCPPGNMRKISLWRYVDLLAS